jgi:predicted Zn-dependent protease
VSRPAAVALVLLLASAGATHRWADEPALRALADAEGRALLARVEVYEDPALIAYLGGLGQRLTGAALPFHVLRDPTLALFALPTGEVFVHTGLLAVADNEAQLAAALAHELAHVFHRDALETVESDRVAPRLEGEALASRTAAAIFAQGLPVTARAAITGYGRVRERAADATALASLIHGGLDPGEAPAMFRRLAAWSRQAGPREIFVAGNRRQLEARVASTRALLDRRRAAAASSRSRDSEEFARVMPPVVRDNAYEDVRQGRFALARRQLDRVAAATPDDPRLHLYSGELHRLQAQRVTSLAERDGHFVQARTAYERALALDPALADAHRQLGLLYYAMRDLGRARAELEQYLALAPAAADRARIGEYLTELAR